MKLYGIDPSQPYRSVKWLLLMKDISFEEIYTMPGSRDKGGSRHTSFLKMCPAGNVPLLEDDDGFLIWESHAIMIYLCEKYGWTDLYPEDIKLRALTNQWLHWHHTNSRRFTIGLFAPVVRKDLKIPDMMIQIDRRLMGNAAKLLNEHLSSNKYLCGDSPTIADISIYGDIGQTRKKHLDLFDFTPFPALQEWMNRMEELPKHKEAHMVFNALRGMFNSSKL